MLSKGEITVYSDTPELKGGKKTERFKGGAYMVEIPCNGGIVLVQ